MEKDFRELCLSEAQTMQHNAVPLLNSTDHDIKLELEHNKKYSESFSSNSHNNHCYNQTTIINHISSLSYSPPPQSQSVSPKSKNRMSSTFIQNHLSAQDIAAIEDDENFHRLELSPAHFRDLSINFYPGFAERNAFLGHFKSTRRRRKKNKKNHNDQTPLYKNEHKSDDYKRKDTEDAFENTVRALSNIPGKNILSHP